MTLIQERTSSAAQNDEGFALGEHTVVLENTSAVLAAIASAQALIGGGVTGISIRGPLMPGIRVYDGSPDDDTLGSPLAVTDSVVHIEERDGERIIDITYRYDGASFNSWPVPVARLRDE